MALCETLAYGLNPTVEQTVSTRLGELSSTTMNSRLGSCTSRWCATRRRISASAVLTAMAVGCGTPRRRGTTSPTGYPILEAVANETTALIVEGEKDVDNLSKLNVTATCNAGGAGKWRPEHSQYLKGADVVIIPDNDRPGREHADLVAASLLGIAARVRVLTLPNLPEKGDTSDWIASGGTAEQLWTLVKEAPELKSGEQKDDGHHYVGKLGVGRLRQ